MDLSRVDLNLLVALDALVSECSVTKAAKRVGVGQSAMSSTLRRLRVWFGDPLLVRDGRTLVPTPLALSLAEPVREALDSVAKAMSPNRRFDPLTDLATFSIRLTDYHLTLTLLHPLLARLAHESPGIRMQIRPAIGDVADELVRGRADVLITPREAMPEVIGQFPHRLLYRDRYVVAVDADNPDVGDEFTLEQFSTLPYIATATGEHRALIEDLLDALEVPRYTEVITEYGIAPFLMRGTRMFTVLHERLATAIQPVTNLKLFPLPVDNLGPITEMMVWTPRTDGDPARRWLRSQLIELAAGITSAAPGSDGDGHP